MKKLINKLFEKLGYVPKEEYYEAKAIINTLTKLRRDTDAHCLGIKNGTATYHSVKLFECFAVFEYCEAVDNNRLVKVFPYHDTDSEDYARICAEELCDMLNEKY